MRFRREIMVSCLLLLLLVIPDVQAKPKVKCDVSKVAEHKLLVTFSWTVTVYSDKAWDACNLTISFRDKKAHELYKVKETHKLKIGTNTFSGNEICPKEKWESIDKYITTMDCVF